MAIQAPDVNRMLERLDRLEQQNARWQRRNTRTRVVATLAVIVAGATWLLNQTGPGRAEPAQPNPKIVRAEQFVVTDADGNMQGMLVSSFPNGPALLLFEPGSEPGSKKPSVILAVGKGGPFLDLYSPGANSKRRVLLAATEDATLNLFDTSGQERAVLSVNKAGSGLMLNDEAGKPRVGLAALDGKSGLDLAAEDGKQHIVMDARNSLLRLAFYDENGKARLGLGFTKAGPGIDLFDETGKTLFSRP